MVAEGHTFVGRKAEPLLYLLHRFALVCRRGGNIAPMLARKRELQALQKGRQYLHALFLRGTGVIDGNFAYGFPFDRLVEALQLYTVGIGASRSGTERLLLVFYVSVVRSAEDGKQTVRPPDGVENALDRGGGQGVEIERFVALPHERAVFADENRLFPDGKEQLFQVGVLPAAGGGEKNAALRKARD